MATIKIDDPGPHWGVAQRTGELRFVLRRELIMGRSPSGDEMGIGQREVRILQQQSVNTMTGEETWDDVPLVRDA